MRAVGTITDSPLIKIKGVDVMYNFELKHKEYIDEISSTGYIYTHKCGAKLIYMENDDKNRVYSVAFNTLPTNDKGIPHIMEHSVLCGSENYRVKDPFNILDKGSIHTYLNAVTYSDKTIYPIASTNLTDFDTMVKVYTDGVFKPLIYEREGIFRQEGWNSDGKKLNGIVLNEMKGVFSAPDIVLRHKLKRELFKDSDYANYSGGNPDNIPELDYNEFLDFHRKYYHGSNATFYFYGDLDINKYLEFLDKEYLCNFEKRDRLVSPDFQPQSYEDIVVESEKDGDNIMEVMYTYGNVLDFEKCLFMDILCDAVCNVEDGQIKEEIIKSGLGSMVEAVNDDSRYMPYVEITVKGSKEKDLNKFKEIIEKCWEDIAENGIDQHKLQSVINSYKFFTMEQDFGYKPVGLFYNLLLHRSVMYGQDNFESMKMNKLFDAIEKIDVKEFVKKYLLGKGCYGILIAGSKANKEEVPVPPKNNKPLDEYRKMEDTPEEVAKIHSIQVSEIDKKALYIPYEVNEDNIFAPVKSKEIVYVDLVFDVSALEKDELSRLGLYKYIVNVFDKDVATDIDFYTGGFSAYFSTLKSKTDFEPVIIFKIKALRENIFKALDIFKKVICQKYSDYERLKNLMEEYKQDLYETYEESGNSVAYNTCLANISSCYAYEEAVGGINNYHYVCDTSNIEKTAREMESLAEKIFTSANMFYVVTGNSCDKEAVSSYIEDIKKNIPTGEKHQKLVLTSEKKNIAYSVNTNVSYNAIGCVYKKVSGVLRVAKQIVTSEYIWDNIRLKGGAYGGGCGFLNGNYFYMYSYRDPNINKSYEVFKNVGNYLSEIDMDEKHLNRFIIGAVNVEDAPLKNNRINSIVLRRHYNGVTQERLDLRREEMLSVSLNDIREVGQELTTAMENIVMSTVSDQTSIEKSELFKNIIVVK